MKLKIFEPKFSGHKVPRKEIYLKLINTEDGDNGGISLVACDEAGDVYGGGHLLRLSNNGKIRRHKFVSNYFGFQLDGDGRIEIE